MAVVISYSRVLHSNPRTGCVTAVIGPTVIICNYLVLQNNMTN